MQLQKQQTRVRELQEQIQQDDRVETLQKSLKGTQDRAESLEFQLSKLKQVLISRRVTRFNH
jgi:chaperonin cofactor prefoldin